MPDHNSTIVNNKDGMWNHDKMVYRDVCHIAWNMRLATGYLLLGTGNGLAQVGARASSAPISILAGGLDTAKQLALNCQLCSL